MKKLQLPLILEKLALLLPTKTSETLRKTKHQISTKKEDNIEQNLKSSCYQLKYEGCFHNLKVIESHKGEATAAETAPRKK